VGFVCISLDLTRCCCSARQWNVDKSLKMLSDTIKWRSEYKPQNIKLEEIEREISSGKLYISSRRDKLGRPVVYYKTRIDDTAHDDVRVRNMVWLLEELTRRMDTDHTAIERSVWLVDFENADFVCNCHTALSLSLVLVLVLSLSLCVCVDGGEAFFLYSFKLL
jgi:hypothetical protein